MKRVMIAILLMASISTQAQFFSDYEENLGTFRLGAAYTHDFPGLNGLSFNGEFSKSMSEKWQGALGFKWINLSGYPRTSTVNEYTRASSIDFSLYFVPVNEGPHLLRLGLGYSFVFFEVRRSFPLIQNNGTEKITSWPVQDAKGKSSGANLIAEYEYRFPDSRVSAGLRAAWYKAYDRVSAIGPFLGVRL